MNWRCEVYVYEDTLGGWTTHVAGRRRVLPPVPDIMGGRLSARLHKWSGWTWDNERRIGACRVRWRGAVYGAWSWFTAFWHNYIHMRSLHLIPLRNIGLQHDGETFRDDSPGDCADRLERLSAMGYVVPRYVIDQLRQEVG